MVGQREVILRKSQFKLPTELVTLIASGHIYVEGKVDLLKILPR
jgi:hypothetical protein